MIRATHAARALAGAAVIFFAAGCSQFTGPTATESWALDTLNGQPLPATLDRATHRSIDVVAGFLRLHGDGRAAYTSRVRITEAGGEPVEMQEESVGRWRRTGDLVEVTLNDGWIHTFDAVAGGERLRTAAIRCTRDCAMATAVLHIFEFRRTLAAGPAGGV